MRRSFVVLGSLLVTVMACSEPVSPSTPLGAGHELSAPNMTLRGIVEMNLDREPQLELRMGLILVPLRTSENVKAGLMAAVGVSVSVSGNFAYGQFQVVSYVINAEE